MENIIRRQHLAKVKFLFLLLACGILLLARADFSYAVTKTTIATGLKAAVGAAIDESKNQLYFVEYNAGTLKCVNLFPPTALVLALLSQAESLQRAFLIQKMFSWIWHMVLHM